MEPVANLPQNPPNIAPAVRTPKYVVQMVVKCVFLVFILPITLILFARGFKNAVKKWVDPASASTAAQGTDKIRQSTFKDESGQPSVRSQEESPRASSPSIQSGPQGISEQQRLFQKIKKFYADNAMDMIELRELDVESISIDFLEEISRLIQKESISEDDKKTALELTFNVFFILHTIDTKKEFLYRLQYNISRLNNDIKQLDWYKKECLVCVFDYGMCSQSGNVRAAFGMYDPEHTEIVDYYYDENFFTLNIPRIKDAIQAYRFYLFLNDESKYDIFLKFKSLFNKNRVHYLSVPLEKGNLLPVLNDALNHCFLTEYDIQFVIETIDDARSEIEALIAAKSDKE